MTAENSTSMQADKKKNKKNKDSSNSGKLENYEMRQHIGEGAFGSVNLAIEKATG